MGLLDDRVAVVTGAGRGIGQATAVLFVTEGAKVIINDLDDGPAQETLKLCHQAGGTAAVSVGSIADSVYTDQLMNHGTSTSNYGMGFDPVANALWIYDDDTEDFIRIN